MSVIRADHWLPSFVDNAPVASGTTFTSDPTLQNGAACVTIQCIATNGAAGTLYADATNQRSDASSSSWLPCQNVPVSANGSAYMVFSPVDQLTGMHAMRIRFVPTSGGNITVAVNYRHYAH